MTTWTPEKVISAPDPIQAFAEYTQQTLGVPWPTTKDMVILRQRVHDLFDHYPKADYYTLCRVVAWNRSRHRRYSRIWMVVESFRDAWVAGALPELDRNHDEDLEGRIREALAVETDPQRRRRLIAPSGATARRAALADWMAHRSEQP